MRCLNFILVTLLIVFVHFQCEAQYFGRNKPQYSQHDFKVLETDNFRIHHYLHENRELLDRLAREAENWYHMHLNVLIDSIPDKNPLIFYNHHADFQQTNTVFGVIGAGTGGVTEGLKNRVVMPIAFTNHQTNHVLGHELVHAFQFNSILNGDSTSMNNMQNLPLWFVEGMAEYLSIGRVDPHTAMWIRDAVLNDDIPQISDLSNYTKYFPYRFGQAFLAFIGGVYGDDIIYPLMMRTAMVGIDQAIKDIIGTDSKTLSGLWVQTMQRGFAPFLQNKKERPQGKELLIDTRAGKINISPSISPNGEYVIFLSERSIFSMDLYLADARSGIIVRKINSQNKGIDIDELNFIESSGTWSPDSKEFAYVAYSKGRNVLVIYNIERPKKSRTLVLPQLRAFTNPAWSPDGKSILLSGKKNGQTDLYLYILRSGQLKQITDDPYAEIHASWSPDGNNIIYSTDEWSWRQNRPNGKYSFNIAITDPDGGRTQVLNIFNGANNLNPVMDQGGLIYFLSDRDGFRNIYRFDTRTNKLEQLTQSLTGISGITPFSPAITLSGGRSRPRLVYTHFYNREYKLYTQLAETMEGQEAKPEDVTFAAAVLPPGNNKRANIIQAQLVDQAKSENNLNILKMEKPYKGRFKLDYIGGGTGLGMNTANSFGTNAALVGGIDMLFSDMLGDHLLMTGLALNGEIYDAGGMVQYLNRKKRLNWGVGISHIPFRSGALINRGLVLLEDGFGNRIPSIQYDLFVNRIFQDQFNLLFQYPFSVTRRLEFGSGYALFYERRDLISNYYSEFGQLIFQQRNRLDAPGSLSMFFNNAAFVGDNSYFGMASPMRGGRYRVSSELFWGDLQYQTTLIDFRKYHFAKPFNFSYRIIQFSRHGRDADRLFRLFPIDPMLVRGFQRITLDEFRFNHNLDVNQISGTQMLIGNAEIRIPFTGIKQLALFPSSFLFTELAIFADAGMAWQRFQDFADSGPRKPAVLASTGVSLRLNLFGAIILEPFYALPIIGGKLQRGTFGLNFIPGW
jgi:Tol biopolymer transport system component